jgi:small conductance mechanosensitive channel
VSISLHLTLVVVVVAQALHYVGVEPIIIRRTFVTIILAAVGLIVLFRPYIPTLPFKVGNTIKTGDLFGKVEATTFLNTRLRTLEGLTIFVPNRKILDDYLINYHFTPTRRVKVNVGIAYDQDILKAKQIMEAIMIADPRVKTKPRPVVYVLELADSCVTLGGRCWVDNLKYWVTKCELTEKVKLRFDQEGIIIAFPQRDVHLYHETPLPAFPKAGSPEIMSVQSDRHAIDRV